MLVLPVIGIEKHLSSVASFNEMPSNDFLVISYPSTATQIPTPTTTPASTVNVTPPLTPTSTPTLTSTPTEEKEAAESPVPGFELLTSLFILIAVAYLIRRR